MNGVPTWDPPGFSYMLLTVETEPEGTAEWSEEQAGLPPAMATDGLWKKTTRK